MRYIPSLLTLSLTLSACGSLLGSIGNPLPTGPQLTAVSRQTLQPGQQITVPLNSTALAGTTVTLSVTTPAPDLLTASITGTTLTLTAAATATPQGLIPVTVTAADGTNTVTTRVPVEIGTLIQQEFARFNALRAQANVNPVTFNEDASMNCWLHGRYTIENKVLEHTENLALPFATQEGRDCASKSNIAYNTSPAQLAPDHALPLSDVLFSMPFHAVSMIRAGQQSVGIGLFSKPSSYSGYVSQGGGITSSPSDDSSGVMFPGNGATTDLGSFYGGENPDPMTSCPTFDRSQPIGLPLIISTGKFTDTTATNATLTEDGQSVPVCAFGSTQYVNTTGGNLNYVDGPQAPQAVGRSILRSYAAVFVIPQKPLNPGKTYAVSVNVNGQPTSWSFKTSSTLKPQSLNTQSAPALN